MANDTSRSRSTPANVERKLVAILSADVAGYSRLMGADEVGTLHTLTASRVVTDSLIQQHRGRIVGTAGDSILAEFASAVDAVWCAVEVQQSLKGKNAALPAERRMEFRIGINVGDVVVEGEQIYGDGVNVAARLQGLADAGGLFISGTVYDQIGNKLPLHYEDLGERTVKNIAKPVRVYRVVLEGPSSPVEQASSLRAARMAAPPEGQGEGAARKAGSSESGVRSPKSRSNWVMVTVVGLLLVACALAAVRYLSRPPLSPQSSSLVTQEAPALPLPDKPSIVVLPFTNMSGDPAQEYFSDGITEVLTSDLSRISSLFVIARNTAFTCKDKAANVQDVGRELGVRYVLEGSVQKTTEQVRIVAQLIDTTTGGHLWSERYDRPLKDIFALQDDIVQKIVTTLKLQISLQEQGIVVHKTTDNLEAYDFYLRGFDQGFRVTPEANTQARQMLEQAIVLDPRYAEAYALLGLTYWQEWIMGWSQDPRTIERAGELARQALALDDTLPYTHMLLSSAHVVKNQPELALAAAERAIALDPNSADAYAWLARTLNPLERSPEAIRAIEQAMQLNPRYPFWYLLDLGWAYYQTGRYEEAMAAEQQVLRHNPHYLFAAIFLATSSLEVWLAQQEQDPRTPEQALEAARQVVAVSDSAAVAHIVLGWASVLNKQYAQAVAAIERALALNPAIASILPPLVTGILNYVGRPEEVLKLMEQALRLTPRPPARYFMQLGHAYYLTGRTEEAIEPLRRFLSVFPHRVDAHVLLAAAYSEVGREDEARAEAAALLLLSPQYSLDVMQQRWPYQDPAQVERLLAALRKAGLK